MKQKTNFNEKGITIIALIITIILLLILVGVSINLVIKGNLFGSAEKAVDGTNAKAEQEQTRVDELMGKLNEINDKEENDSIIQELKDGIELIKVALGTNKGTSDILDELNEIRQLTFNACQDITDTERVAIKTKIKAALNRIDTITSETNYKGEILLKGDIARDIVIDGMFLKIDNLSSEELGLNISDIDEELATIETSATYIDKVDVAIKKARTNYTRASATEAGLVYILDYYMAENDIIKSSTSNLDELLAENALKNMKNILSMCLMKIKNAANDTNTDDDRQTITFELETCIIAIDYIAEQAHWNGQKLLDGTYSNISKINSTTLGCGTKLPTDVTTMEKAENAQPRYQSAIEMLEKELAKLGV